MELKLHFTVVVVVVVVVVSSGSKHRTSHFSLQALIPLFLPHLAMGHC